MSINYNISAKETTYNGCVFRSRLEARWAAFFDLIGKNWSYEPVDIEGWSPDFILKGLNEAFIEVKPVTEFHLETALKIRSSTDQTTLLLGCGIELNNSSLVGWFVPNKEDLTEELDIKHYELFLTEESTEEQKAPYSNKYTISSIEIIEKENRKNGLSFIDCVSSNKIKYLWRIAGNITRFTYKKQKTNTL